MSKHNETPDWKQIFGEVMNCYEDARTLNTTSSCAGVYAGMADTTDKQAPSVRMIRPSTLDFVCDVELAARSTLTKQDYSLFIHYYANQNEVSTLSVTPEWEETQERIINTCAMAFKRKRIYPITRYFKSKDVGA